MNFGQIDIVIREHGQRGRQRALLMWERESQADTVIGLTSRQLTANCAEAGLIGAVIVNSSRQNLQTIQPGGIFRTNRRTRGILPFLHLLGSDRRIGSLAQRKSMLSQVVLALIQGGFNGIHFFNRIHCSMFATGKAMPNRIDMGMRNI